jgi:hypothetical protein
MNLNEELLGVVARCRVGLFVIGFAVGSKHRDHFLREGDWISPLDVLSILSESRYAHRTLKQT